MGIFLEHGDRKDLQQSVARSLDVEALSDDGDEDIDRNGDPDLRFHGVLRSAVTLLDAKMPFLSI
jgi:hypothetical protein